MLELLIYLVALYVVLHRKNIYKTTKKRVVQLSTTQFFYASILIPLPKLS